MKLTLKAARVNANLLQDDAAKLIGISTATLQNYESGKSFPDVPVIKQIERVYNIAYADIIFLPTDYT